MNIFLFFCFYMLRSFIVVGKEQALSQRCVLGEWCFLQCPGNTTGIFYLSAYTNKMLSADLMPGNIIQTKLSSQGTYVCKYNSTNILIKVTVVGDPMLAVGVDKTSCGDEFCRFWFKCQSSGAYKVHWHFTGKFVDISVWDHYLVGLVPYGSAFELSCSAQLGSFRYQSRPAFINLIENGLKMTACSHYRTYLMSLATEPAQSSADSTQVVGKNTTIGITGSVLTIKLNWRGNEAEEVFFQKKQGNDFETFASSSPRGCLRDFKGWINCSRNHLALRVEPNSYGDYRALRSDEEINWRQNVLIAPEVYVKLIGLTRYRYHFECFAGNSDYSWKKWEFTSTVFSIKGQYESFKQTGNTIIVFCSCFHTDYPSRGSTGFPTCRFLLKCTVENGYGIFSSEETSTDDFISRRRRQEIKTPYEEL